MKTKIKEFLLLMIILFIGFIFRFNNINWDENNHLHPDERFLTMVGNAMVLPKNIAEYLDPKISKLNPNNIGHNFFVYGSFPLIINKYLSVFLKSNDYNNYTLLGRQLSAFFDLLNIIFIYKIAKILFSKNKIISYWSALIYALLVLPIQLSHFFAVDNFLNFFMLISFYFSLKQKLKKSKLNIIFSALFFALAFASKITAIFILPLILVFFIQPNLKKSIFNIGIFLIFSYLFLRFVNPYYFIDNNLLNPSLNKIFIENIKYLRILTVKDINNSYPPMVQWLNKNSLIHSFVNNIIFGIGIIQAIFIFLGIVLILLTAKFKIKKLKIKMINKNLKLTNQKNGYESVLITAIWMIGVFIFQSLQVTPTLRYFIYLYPFFAISGGFGFYWLLERLRKKLNNKTVFYLVYFILYITLFIWPLMFSSIYLNKNTRVEASVWIYKNLPNNSIILSESWDDALPLLSFSNYNKQFQSEQLPVFDPDTKEKWEKMNYLLQKGDYYILSSNRGWGSIPTVPKKYPLMSRFYDDLLAGKNSQYKKIKEFTSYPRIEIGRWKLEINDDWADEGFTVYDHPKVIIFSRK